MTDSKCPSLGNSKQDAVSSHQRRHREEARAQQVAASGSVSVAQSMASSAGGRYQYAPSSMGENVSSNSKSLGDASISNGGPPPRDSGPRSLPSGGYAANQIPAAGAFWTPALVFPLLPCIQNQSAGLWTGENILSSNSESACPWEPDFKGIESSWGLECMKCSTSALLSPASLSQRMVSEDCVQY